ncbi:hypothetical protein [Streptomyces sp. MK37H]|uniref:hypothetical protein n=1 Tax=Streptomyces sp. MK37H TaxID=2699117 RepID=UPI001FF9A09F|nr:hypothetical protein [Streptomyces sp. MK37H]
MSGEDRSPDTAPEGAAPDETPDPYGAFPRLTDQLTDQRIAFLSGHGTRRSVAASEAVFREGDRGTDFLVVLSGTIAIIEHHGTPDERVPRVHLLITGSYPGSRMSRHLVDQIERHPRVSVALDTEVREARGDDALRAVVVEHRRTGERRVLNACSLFVFIGTKPCTDWLSSALALEDRGFVLTGAEAEARAAAGVREGQGRRCLPLETSPRP